MNVLIIGQAKTGTTGISKNIQNSLEHTRYYLEPKNINFAVQAHEAEKAGTSNIVKIIFEHWNNIPNLRKALLLDEVGLIRFDKKIFIVRDPRDNLISRIFYMIHPMIRNRKELSDAVLERWIAFVEMKERVPGQISFLELADEYKTLFGADIFNSIDQSRNYIRFVHEYAEKTGGYVLKYEDFIDRNLSGLESYLGFRLSEDTDVGAALQRTVRSKSYNNWKGIFLERDIQRMKTLFDADWMEEYGYTDWELDTGRSLTPKEGSLYIRSLICDAKAKNAEEAEKEMAPTERNVQKKRGVLRRLFAKR